ncbi:heme lyase CcmF/NrfE family subunit [Robiginitomaculum antarcticum]|uniref:heme lyase CcmF/NrfE family subunit n=1 Tax=Robiginitomaculum antarcticum TaxID=437507 RepID=UPI00035CB1A9|nr:heme lyase CcmF/NrfE family subunit [Robiginitomaculum antarcticum]
MIAELGHIALIAAFCVAILQFALPLWGAARGHGALMALASRAALLQFILIAASFIALTTSFLLSDFSVLLVANHSALSKPLLYKISGVWGNHEGSILLWVLILALYGALAATFGKALPAPLKARALAIQGGLGATFIGFTLFTSNPFERLFPAAMDGTGLNPVLQDPGLAIHPPLLYMGYVGFSLAFSFAIAALIEGKVDAIWARWLRPWVLLAWSFLTAGITIGSFWAYYELGWGGWWMWDPVENVSFIPWLLGTALLHSIMVLGTRHAMSSWTVLLAISTFSLCLIGTFIVRSGILVSVHSFAVDPTRGVVILIILAVVTGAALTLYAIRSSTLTGSVTIATVSRGGALILNNILLIVAAFIVLLGTFYPLFIDMFTGEKITVAEPFFNRLYTPVMLLLIVFMSFGPLLKWRADSLSRIKGKLIAGAIVAVLSGLALYAFGRSAGAVLGYSLAALLAYGTFTAFLSKTPAGPNRLRRLTRLPAATYGFLLAHLGMAVVTAGITAMSTGSAENIARLKPGQAISTAGYEFTLTDLGVGEGENYQFMRAVISVTHKGRTLPDLLPERRYYDQPPMFTTEAGFRLRLKDTVFVAIGEGDPQKGYIVRAYYQPFVSLIWIGALIMALAGFISIGDKRMQINKDLTS